MAGSVSTFQAHGSVELPTRRRRALLRGSFAIAMALCAAFAFGLSAGDAASLRSFTDSVDRWQSNPEFRSLAAEYSVSGSEALRTRPLLVPADRLIIVARSCPLLPERYGLTPTCRLHYEDFTRGPLSAYLHLCDEQAVHYVVGMVEDLGRRTSGAPAPRAELDAFLGAFKLDTHVVRDAGALWSVAALLSDTEAASRPFRIRTVIGAALASHVQALAREMGFPPDAGRMSVAQQRAVLDRLDGYVRRHDPELWRTKQVSDFCAGIWAHAFGRSYNLLIKPFLALCAACRVALVVLLLWAVARRLRAQAELLSAASPARAFQVQQSAHSPAAVARPATRGDPARTDERAGSLTATGPSAPAPAPPRPAGSRRRRA
jgi:hypothetical protein